MVAPSDRLLGAREEAGAKLTVMADTVEILKFREHREATGRDDWACGAIEDQLRRAVARGHDVQLHLHTAYGRARADGRRWALDFREYDPARIGYERMSAFVREGKDYLEGLLRPVRPGYSCFAFRAANWSMSPSADIVRALVANGIRIDTSVFKHGRRDGLVRFDYSRADSDVVPWPVDASDVCRRDEAGRLFEFPICCELRPIWSFLSRNRVNNALGNLRHPLPPSANGTGAAGASTGRGGAAALLRKGAGLAGVLFRSRALKLDFNQCSGRQMIAALHRLAARHAGMRSDLPVVLMGHSKIFTRHNEGQLRRFLRYVASRPDLYGFATFDRIDVEAFRKPAGP